MKTLIIYDSVFGNTGKIAQHIYDSFDNKEEVKICHIDYVNQIYLDNIKLLIVGSPTRGFRPTESILKFIKNIPSNSLKEIYVAAFDTRLSLPDLNSSFIRFIVKTGGYAANTISSQLLKKQAQLVIPPEGFLVTGEEGPLKNGELERASIWVREIINHYHLKIKPSFAK